MTVTRKRVTRRPWSEADDAVLRQRYPNEPTQRLAADLQRSISATYARADKLGLSKSAEYLASPAACRTNGRQGIGTRFEKGHVPFNKGLRRPGWAPGRMRETQFRKGERSRTAELMHKPIGTERVSKDGYLERKINDDLPLNRRWRAVHLILWEETNGPIPPSHAIVFRNGDKADIRLDNLDCITRAELMRRNAIHNLPEPLASTIRLLGSVTRQINKRAKNEEQN